MESVLIISGSSPQARLIQVSLQKKWHCMVSVVNDGAEALAFCRHSPPDLIICDTELPSGDGFAAIENIQFCCPVQAVILLSIQSWPCDVARAIHVGADEYITKPSDLSVLLDVVRRLFPLHKEEQRNIAA